MCKYLKVSGEGGFEPLALNIKLINISEYKSIMVREGGLVLSSPFGRCRDADSCANASSVFSSPTKHGSTMFLAIVILSIMVKDDNSNGARGGT
jgi:hypothetical protein